MPPDKPQNPRKLPQLLSTQVQVGRSQNESRPSTPSPFSSPQDSDGSARSPLQQIAAVSEALRSQRSPGEQLQV